MRFWLGIAAKTVCRQFTGMDIVRHIVRLYLGQKNILLGAGDMPKHIQAHFCWTPNS